MEEPIPGAEERLAENGGGGGRPPRRHVRVATIVGVVLVLAVLVGFGSVALSSGTSTGSALVDRTEAPAPGLSLSSLLVPTRTISLSEYRGKGLVLNFWSSWCVACRIEMPLLESAYLSEHGKVGFLGIDTNDTRNAARDFLAQVHVTYPCAFDPDLKAASAYGVFGLPVTVFISAGGRMLGRHIGQFDATTLNEALQRAFDRSGSP